ncbi:type 1 fimbrial protein [Pseudomonas sp. p50]|uniref:fimbrial protein n=1 Tax=Pseudomonas sp. p50(2008) TaxID=2816832 RepID=UPI00188DB3A7|nr:fimbrial protein [Pseudomonas sp. p50(2008)]MBF4557645.1 type 1 fimbrial protein [Pseudomonas sp. p50(2008)]
MKPTLRCLTGLLGLVAGGQAPVALATDNACEWLGGGSGIMTFTQRMEDVYVPRDAPVGSVISKKVFRRTPNAEGRSILCSKSDNTVTLKFNAQSSVPPLQDTFHGNKAYRSTSALLPTNIPGVAAQFELGFPFNGSAMNSFVSDFGSSIVPFSASHRGTMGASNLNFALLESSITLIKTGPIAPGLQTFNGQELFSGTFAGIPGKAFRAGLNGNVTVAHCGSSTVSVTPVPLGEWNQSEFTGPGYTTTAIPFSINLKSCIADDTNQYNAYANINFEGAGGSVPVTPAIPGVFTLNSASDAKGVGIQILMENQSTPIELNTEVPIKQITSGETELRFAARYYQVDASRDIVPGEAKGTLNFTITYK